MTTITRSQFIANYKAAAERATVCAKGLAFAIEDRITLTAQREQLGMDYTMAASLVGGNDHGKHYNRFELWDRQIRTGVIRIAAPATGEHIGVGAGAQAALPFDGRIKTKADIQPAFNRAAMQLVKLGITNPQDASAYLANGFQHAFVEQKIDIQAERFVADVRVAALTKDQAHAALDRAKALI